MLTTTNFHAHSLVSVTIRIESLFLPICVSVLLLNLSARVIYTSTKLSAIDIDLANLPGKENVFTLSSKCDNGYEHCKQKLCGQSFTVFLTTFR